MNAEDAKHFIAWCRLQGAVRVKCGEIVVEFAGRPVAAAPQPEPSSPIDDDETLSDDERRKAEVERRMFGSSL